MSKLGEVVFSDLGSLCVPQKNISDVREIYKWNSVPYETCKYSGTMLTALKNARPEDVQLNPKFRAIRKYLSAWAAPETIR